MIIKKPYEISSSEKNRIRNLHERANQLLSEGIQPTPAVSVDPCYTFVSTMSPSAAGVWNPANGPLDPGSAPAGDIDCCQMLIGNFVGPYGDTAGPGMMQSHCDTEWNSVSGVAPVSSGWHKCCTKFGGHSVTVLSPDEESMFGKPATGFEWSDSGRQEDLEEVRYMNELYEVTLGHEDTPNPLELEEMDDQGYADKEDESLGMRTGAESGKKQSDKARREDSYGKWGTRDYRQKGKFDTPENMKVCKAAGGSESLCSKHLRVGTIPPKPSGTPQGKWLLGGFFCCALEMACCEGSPIDTIKDMLGENTVYELPKRFGNKRLTESQLIDMVNTIVKEY
jgi:hypothetical protein